MKTTTVVFVLAALMAAPSCKKKSEDGAEGEAPAAEATKVTETPPDPAPTPTEPAEPKAPMVMETEATAADKLGTLSDGLGVEVGKVVPDATAKDLEGAERSLHAMASEGPLLVVFYRGGWCPYCNYQVRSLTEAYPEFEKRGLTPVLVSVDAPDAASATQKTYEIPFPVLSDPDLALHEAFNVIHQVSPEEFEQLKGFGVDLEKFSGRDHHKFAVPGIFVLDKKGTVKWAHVDTDYKTRPSTEQLLGALDKAGFAAE